MDSKLTKYFPLRKIIGNIEVKIIFEIIIQIKRIKKSQSKFFLLTGLPDIGKTFSLTTLSDKLGKDIPLVFSSGPWISSCSFSKKSLLFQMSRKAIGIKFYQENFIMKGILVNLEIKNKKVNCSSNHIKLTLKSIGEKKNYYISQELLKKILNKKIKIGDNLLINRTTGDIYNYKNDDLFYYKEKKVQKLEYDSGIEKIIITEQLVTLEELDNVNQKTNLMSKYFSNQPEEHIDQTRENLDNLLKKWVRYNKIKIVKGLIVIDGIEWVRIKEYNFLKELLSKFLSPSILTVAKSDFDRKRFLSNFSQGKPWVDLSNKNISVSFKPLNCKEIFEIIRAKCIELDLYIKKNAIGFLVKIGLNCGLRYSLYILSVSRLIKQKKGIGIKDIKISYEIFLNSKRCIILTTFQHFKIFY